MEKLFINDCYYLRIRYEDKFVQICVPMDVYIKNKKTITNYDDILEEILFEQLKRMNYDNV